MDMAGKLPKIRDEERENRVRGWLNFLRNNFQWILVWICLCRLRTCRDCWTHVWQCYVRACQVNNSLQLKLVRIFCGHSDDAGWVIMSWLERSSGLRVTWQPFRLTVYLFDGFGDLIDNRCMRRHLEWQSATLSSELENLSQLNWGQVNTTVCSLDIHFWYASRYHG